MDFFEQQQQARRHTRLMVVMFTAAVAAVVAVLNVAGALGWAIAMGTPLLEPGSVFSQAPRQLYIGVTAVTLAIIAFGSISALIRLSAGGSAVAEMVGARLVSRDSSNNLERRLLNVVEEMSIASGITMPQVYVMDAEPAINAFAAGYSPNEAVVAVTRGTLEGLNRDELQGVIGHEFSHILNGDMRLNIRLLGVISGIVMIGALGRFLMDARSSHGSSSNSNSSNSRDTDLRIFLVGLCLWLVGSIGVLAGRVIKAAISRQREFLADAASVQFTRNPEGIGTALYKIGRQNGRIHDRHAEDLSHMYFGESVSGMFGLLDTHPPVDQRITRLMGPSAMPLLRDKVKNQPVPAASLQSMDMTYPDSLVAAAAASTDGRALSGTAWGAAAATLDMTPQSLIDSVGHPTPGHYQAARRLLQDLPKALLLATRTADGARAVLFTLLLDDGAVRVAQLESIAARHGEKIANACAALQQPLRDMGPRARMPVMELLIPCLIPLPQAERDAILAQVDELARIDRKLTIVEFVLLTLCRRHLSGPIKGTPPVKHAGIQGLVAEAGVVFSVLAHAGGGGIAAFGRGMEALGLHGGVLKTPAELGMAAVEAALYELKLLAPLKKPAFIKACLAVVMHDDRLTVVEGEVMRALCAALDSPLPPLLDTIEPAD